MRQILFKAKRLDNGEWVEGFLYVRKDGVAEINYYNNELGVERYTHEVDLNTICQFTGLFDKNGNKIWENDIVVAHFRSNKSRQKFKIIFEDGMFLFDNSCVEVPKYDVYGIEVIGNIFDNPELIGEQNG